MVANLQHLIDYLLMHPDTKMRFWTSDMILNVYSDASCLSEQGGHSRKVGHFFLGWLPEDGKPIFLNSAFFTLCSIL